MTKTAHSLQVSLVVIVTALIGLLLAIAHFWPMVWLTLPIFISSIVVRQLINNATLWALIGAIWAVVVVVWRHDMEDHVYVYVAWVVALAVALAEPEHFVDLLARQARRILAVVFGFATFWKLISGEFITGAALWTFGLFDGRLSPLMSAIGVSPESFEAARPAVNQVTLGQSSSFDLALSTYSSVALLAVSISTVALEAFIACSHAMPDSSRLASFRIPALLMFGVLTYAVVPVVPFAVILAIVGAAAARFSRVSMIAMSAMVLVVFVRFFAVCNCAPMIS